MRIVLLEIALSALIAIAACGDDGAAGGGAGTTASAGGGGDHGLPGDPEAGRAVYTKICVACHAADGRGNGGITGGDFVGNPAHLAKSNEELLRIIRDGSQNGSKIMPAQRDALSDQEMKDALSYIRHEFGGTTQ